MPQGEFKIDITFLVDSEGILTVKATDLNSNKTYELVLEGASGLTPEELQKLSGDLM
jgi:molecular chaperone DnaK (HSP70)